MPSRRDIIGLRKLVLTVWLSALLQAITQPVRAEVRVTGQADAVTVETREASVDEVLATLRASFNLQYRTSGPLNRVMTGTYTGSLQQVIARLLEGHNYVMRSSAGGGKFIVFGAGAAGSSVSASGHPFMADARHQELPGPPRLSDVQGWDAATPVGPPIAPPVANANSATQGPPGGRDSPGPTAIEKLIPSRVDRETSSDTTAQAMPPLPNATSGMVIAPVPTATAAGDIPPFPAVKTSQMPPPAPTQEFSFGPPIISPAAGVPTPRPAPAGTASHR